MKKTYAIFLLGTWHFLQNLQVDSGIVGATLVVAHGAGTKHRPYTDIRIIIKGPTKCLALAYYSYGIQGSAWLASWYSVREISSSCKRAAISVPT